MKQAANILSKSELIVSTITELIRLGEYTSGKPIPSINSSANKFGVAKKTVVRAYDKLKQKGLIESKPKMGFFVVNKKPNHRLKILLIIHSFDGHWETLYNSFREKVSSYCDIEIFFHHYNIKVLEFIINRNNTDYDLIIISSFNHPRIKKIIGRIPAYKVLIISRKDRLEDNYNYIIQDFYMGTYNALLAAHKALRKYNKIILCFPEKGGHSITLKKGFLKYCSEFSVSNEIIDSLSEIEIKKKEAIIVINDADLVQLLTVCKQKSWVLGKDVGVVAYNETPLKQIIRDGISVISCNFLVMAQVMADFIKSQKTVKEIIPIEFIKRNSL